MKLDPAVLAAINSVLDNPGESRAAKRALRLVLKSIADAPRSGRKPASDEIRDKITELFHAGEKWKDIAAAVGMSETTVRTIGREDGLRRNKRRSGER